MARNELRLSSAHDEALRHSPSIGGGPSPDDRITITVQGMTTWRVTIAGATLRTLDEASSTRETEIAAGRTIEDQALKILQLKAQV